MTETTHQFSKFSDYLLNLGFCFIASERYTTVRLYNRLSGSCLPDNALGTMYLKWGGHGPTEGLTAYLRKALPFVSGSIFKPDAAAYIEDYGLDRCNSFRRFSIVTKKSDVSPLLQEFFERLFPEAYDRHLCLQWIAHIFQKPSERPSWHLLLTSESGTGKGFLFGKILSPLLIHTVIAKAYSRLTGQFSTILENNLLCLLDDPARGNDNTMTQLKSILSEETASIEHKGEQAKMVNTYTRFILASNDDRPLMLDADDRRWYAPAKLIHKIDKSDTDKFIKSLSDWLAQPDSLSKVYNWFMAYDLEGFDHKHVKQSDLLKQMVNMSKNSYDDFFVEFLDDHKVFQFSDVMTAAKSAGYSLTTANCKFTLAQHGFENKRIPLDGKHPFFWRPKGMSNENAKTQITRPSY